MPAAGAWLIASACLRGGAGGQFGLCRSHWRLALFLRGTTMATISSIGSSGLQAAQLRLDASANNVANMNTPNYRRQVVAQEEAADSAGVRATVQRQQEAEGVALEKEAVEQMSATYAFKANLQTIKTQDEMMGSLLDVKA
jgi:flagellar hook-associated protein FlgK